MLRLLSDEDVHEDIIRGLRRRERSLDIVRAVDAGLEHTPDPTILEWAASHDRILITGDLNTMVGFAWVRVRSGQSMPGVLALLENRAVGRVIDDILLVALCTRRKRSLIRCYSFRCDHDAGGLATPERLDRSNRD